MRASWRLVAAISAFAFAGLAHAAFYAVNPFQNDFSAVPNPTDSAGLFFLDANSAITGGAIVRVPPRVITGLNGMALDPTTGIVYAIAKFAGGRILITLDLATGDGIEVGVLSDNFATLAFRPDGQLFGVTGDGATVRETLYTLDKNTAVATFAATLGAGTDGEALAWSWADNRFYHWSGATSFFESVEATAPYTATPIDSTFPREVFGAAWDAARGEFLVHDIARIMTTWTTAGVRTSAFPAAPSNMRGLLVAFTVTPNPTGNGTVSPAGPILVASGAPFTFTLTPARGSMLQGVGGTCAGTLAGTTFTVTGPTADCTIAPAFALLPAGAATSVTTLSEWMLMLTALVLLAVGGRVIRQRG